MLRGHKFNCPCPGCRNKKAPEDRGKHMSFRLTQVQAQLLKALAKNMKITVTDSLKLILDDYIKNYLA